MSKRNASKRRQRSPDEDSSDTNDDTAINYISTIRRKRPATGLCVSTHPKKSIATGSTKAKKQATDKELETFIESELIKRKNKDKVSSSLETPTQSIQNENKSTFFDYKSVFNSSKEISKSVMLGRLHEVDLPASSNYKDDKQTPQSQPSRSKQTANTNNNHNDKEETEKDRDRRINEVLKESNISNTFLAPIFDTQQLIEMTEMEEQALIEKRKKRTEYIEQRMRQNAMKSNRGGNRGGRGGGVSKPRTRK